MTQYSHLSYVQYLFIVHNTVRSSSFSSCMLQTSSLEVSGWADSNAVPQNARGACSLYLGCTPYERAAACRHDTANTKKVFT